MSCGTPGETWSFQKPSVVEQPTRFTGPKPKRKRSPVPECIRLIDKTRKTRQLVADFGVTMHIAWARHMHDKREFVIGGGTQPSTEPIRAGGLDGSAAAEERDNYHRDAYMNDRNHASGAPRPGRE